VGKEQTMKATQLRVFAVLIVLGALGLMVGAQGSTATPTLKAGATIPPQAALDWNLIAVNTVRAATPVKFQIEGTIYMSYVQAAVYDAVTTIKGRYVPYHALGLTAAKAASPRAAVAAAAYTTLSYYFPAQAASLAAAYTDYLNVTLKMIPPAAKQAGVAIGAAAAADLIAIRWGDGRDATVTTPFGVAPQPPGIWVFAPAPSLQSAQTPWVAAMRPFVLESASQFRAPTPPAITSPEYAQGFNEVKTLGSATSTVRTDAQTAIAQFWNANVINQYNQVFRDVTTQHNLDLVDAVRLLAMGNMVASDAGITCMDSKYHSLLWRPVTAIRNADQDGNAATDTDSTWLPLLTTPNHPEYPSAHGCVTAAVTDVLASVLKTTAINIDVPGATGGGTTLTTSRHFATSTALVEDVANARVWAGLHYRFSTTAGVTIGHQVSKFDLEHAFLTAK
jgi:vanadium-dependent haloperoxidase-like protein